MKELLQHWTPLATIAVVAVTGFVTLINTLVAKGDYKDAFQLLAKVWALHTLLEGHEKRLAELERKNDEKLRVKT